MKKKKVVMIILLKEDIDDVSLTAHIEACIEMHGDIVVSIVEIKDAD